MFKAIWNFFTFWSNIHTKYDRIKSNEEKSKTSTKLGITAIILSFIFSAIVVTSAYGTFACFNFMNNSSFVLGILGFIVCFVLLLGSLIQGLGGALFYSIYQMKLNKKPIGVISLVVWIICLILAIVGSVLLLNTL